MTREREHNYTCGCDDCRHPNGKPRADRAARRRMAQAAADAGHPWGAAALAQMDDTDRQEAAR